MAKGGFSRAAIEETQYLIKKPHAEVREETKQGVEFLGIKRWRLRLRDTWLCFVKTTSQNDFLAKMPPQTIHKHAGDAKEQVHLCATNADGRLQSRRHLCPERHPPQLVTLPERNASEFSICQPDMRIHIHLFPVLNYLLSMYLPRIASTIQISIQICCMMKEHPLVSTLSAVW